MKLGNIVLEPQVIIQLLGALLCGDANGPIGHRSPVAWKKLWASSGQMCTRILSVSVRLRKLRSGILPVLLWGAVAWYMRLEGIITAVTEVTRMARRAMHARRAAEEKWLDCHRRRWRSAQAEISTAWGRHPAAVVVACAASAVAKLAARPACSMFARALRSHSANDVATLRNLAGGGLGSWGRRTFGRPKRRWDDPWVRASGEIWLGRVRVAPEVVGLRIVVAGVRGRCHAQPLCSRHPRGEVSSILQISFLRVFVCAPSLLVRGVPLARSEGRSDRQRSCWIRQLALPSMCRGSRKQWGREGLASLPAQGTSRCTAPRWCKISGREGGGAHRAAPARGSQTTPY